jgi:hypothetical protein
MVTEPAVTRHCRDCRWLGPLLIRGIDAALARCLHPTSRRHELSCLTARSRTGWGKSKDICGELGRHWETRDPGEPVDAPVDGPRGDRAVVAEPT